MSTGRYYFGLGAGAAVMVIVSIIGLTAFGGESFVFALEGFIETIIAGYVLGAAVAELIWWDLFPMNIFKIIFGFAVIPTIFAWSFISAGTENGLLGLFGLALIVPCLGITGAIIGFAASVLTFLSAICCIFHIFSLRNDLY